MIADLALCQSGVEHISQILFKAPLSAMPEPAVDPAAATATPVPADALPWSLAGESVWLLPECALWWPAGATLFVADLHLGKAATFRARGLPVPSGTTQHNLARLAQLVQQHQAERLVLLGDFLHAAEAQSAALQAALAPWRAAHPALELLLVRGNHDRHAGDPPAVLRAKVVDEPFLLGPFAACHHPQRHATHTVLAGHVHPAVRLRGPGRDALRLPCFCIEEGLALLPAFGAFTGGHVMDAVPGRQRMAVGAGRVWAVPQ